jgi:hypothetical protein
MRALREFVVTALTVNTSRIPVSRHLRFCMRRFGGTADRAFSNARPKCVWIPVLCLPLLVGCAYWHHDEFETGTRLDESKIGQIVIGKTTRQEVFRMFGPPHSIFTGQVEFQGDVPLAVERG